MQVLTQRTAAEHNGIESSTGSAVREFTRNRSPAAAALLRAWSSVLTTSNVCCFNSYILHVIACNAASHPHNVAASLARGTAGSVVLTPSSRIRQPPVTSYVVQAAPATQHLASFGRGSTFSRPRPSAIPHREGVHPCSPQSEASPAVGVAFSCLRLCACTSLRPAAPGLRARLAKTPPFIARCAATWRFLLGGVGPSRLFLALRPAVRAVCRLRGVPGGVAPPGPPKRRAIGASSGVARYDASLAFVGRARLTASGRGSAFTWSRTSAVSHRSVTPALPWRHNNYPRMTRTPVPPAAFTCYRAAAAWSPARGTRGGVDLGRSTVTRNGSRVPKGTPSETQPR